MNQVEIHQFLYQFFTKRQATVINNEQGLLTVKLTEQLDQQLMNRPFYWQYVKKLGYQGDPMTVTFISDEQKKEEKGEWVHFGSPRLEQLFQIILQDGKYAELYENVQVTNERTALYPWFVCNFIVRYQGAFVNDELISIGVLLTNGTMRFRFMDEIIDEIFKDNIPDYCYKIPHIISPTRASTLVNQEIKQRIKQKSNDFEQQSLNLYKNELELIDELFKKREDDEIDSLKKNNEQQIYNRLFPQVKLQVINSGLFYLTKDKTNQLMTI
ncbi:YqhG family protein [Bacillaceae bacterium W0354]